MSQKPTHKSLTSMNTDELRRATAEFDREFIADTFAPMDARQRAAWERLKNAKPGKNGRTKAIAVRVDSALLNRADVLARKLKISRAKLIARGLRAMLASQGE